MSEELKSCPFCGGVADFEIGMWNGDEPKEWAVWCYGEPYTCGGQMSSNYKTKEEAARAWNNRADNSDSRDADKGVK